MKSFFKACVSSMKTSGTIKPSSKYLIEDCLKGLDLTSCKVIVEFGPGNGCITQEIINRASKDTKIFSFEINPTFFEYCKNSFSTYDNVHVLEESAFEFNKVLATYGIDTVDCIISSLPLSLFSRPDIDALLKEVNRSLKAQGDYVQYQYSLGNYKQLKRSFPSVNLDLTLRNVPPAFVYHCTSA